MKYLFGAVTTFRFHKELSDFLPRGHRGRDFVRPRAKDATVKHMIEALGVPHTEVEWILVNGDSVSFAHRPREGDRVDVYPRLANLDVTPRTPVRPPQPRITRTCDSCKRVYWEGSHWSHLRELLRAALAPES